MLSCGLVQVRMFKDLIRQKEHMVLPDLAQDLAQVRLSSSSTFVQTTQPGYSIILRLDFLPAAPQEPCFNHAVSSCMLHISTHKHLSQMTTCKPLNNFLCAICLTAFL